MVEISRIVEQNPWWKFGKSFDGYDRTLREYNKADVRFRRRNVKLNGASIYTIHGPRQTGKTTEIKKKILDLIKEGTEPEAICYFSCETLG